MRTSFRPTLVAALILFAPDIAPPNSKGIKVETRLELGPLADRACVAYTVAQGDTLTAIAEKRLGSTTRTKDIVAQNPDITPDRLRIGQVLVLPPLDPKVKDAPHLMLMMAPRRDHAELVQPFAPLPYARYGTYDLVLVPADLVADIGADDRKTREAALKSDRITYLEMHTVGHTVDKDSPIARAEVTLRVVAEKAAKPDARQDPRQDPKLRVDTEVKWFDAAGKPVTLDEHGATTDPKKGMLWLLLFAAGGGGWLLWRMRRQAPQLALA